MTTPEELIQLALQGNQQLVDRSRSQVSSLIQERLARPQNVIQTPTSTSSPVGNRSTPTREGGHGESPYAQYNEYGINPQLYDAINRINAASPFGPNTISVGSGYRSYEEQARLYQRWLDRVPGQAQAAPPGRSNHNHGEAADLEYVSPEARDWVLSVAGDFGIHFPVPGENWHAELVN